MGGIVGLGEVEKRVVFYGKEGISSFNVIRTFIQLPFSFFFYFVVWDRTSMKVMGLDYYFQRMVFFRAFFSEKTFSKGSL